MATERQTLTVRRLRQGIRTGQVDADTLERAEAVLQVRARVLTLGPLVPATWANSGRPRPHGKEGPASGAADGDSACAWCGCLAAVVVAAH